MKKRFILFLLFLFLPLSITRAEYVLPYPSYMPGNKLYNVSRILDKVMSFWHWGNVTSAKYHMKLSDKYLVEAKTLFEYKQYLLAMNALSRSTAEYERITEYILKAHAEGKDTDQLLISFIEQSEVHKKNLEKLKIFLPVEFVWTPENTEESVLLIHKDIDAAIGIRLKLPQNIQESLTNL